jgi:hypothetical protein
MIREAATVRERVAVFGLCVLLHLAALVLVLQQRANVTPLTSKPETVALVSIPAEPRVAPKPPATSLPTKQAPTLQAALAVSVPVEDPGHAPATGATSCGVEQMVLAAILADEVAKAAVREAPPETRSIAGAVVIWNAGWTPASETSGAPLGMVRTTIEASLRTLSNACLDETLAGPRLLPISDEGDGTVFLVIGSGRWSWRDLFNPQLIQPDLVPVPPTTASQ